MSFLSIPFHNLIDITMKILDTRDPYTFTHSWRVAGMSEKVAQLLGLDSEYIEIIHVAAHLHDMGKIGIPDAILNKTSSLSDREYESMKTHSMKGFEIAKKIEILQGVSDYILYHHERWDGGGYPEGLCGRAIPLGSRIIAVADSFDAITSSRTYRQGRSYEEAFKEIERCRGQQFCPDTVDVFLDNQDEIIEVIEAANLEIEQHKTDYVYK
ncbi:MAG: HD-GYP domain-containing protein [Spirochaetales bacterium]|nr:HD-GYP domain-containing protein [Spirochaetales bacterium]